MAESGRKQHARYMGNSVEIQPQKNVYSDIHLKSEEEEVVQDNRGGGPFHQDYNLGNDEQHNHNRAQYQYDDSYYGATIPQAQQEAYPMEVPVEVQEQVEKDNQEEKQQKGKLLLNCVPGLKGKTDRQQFIFKVYGILTVELCVTFGFILITLLVDSIQDFMKETRWLFWTTLAITLVLCFTLYCFNGIARKYPLNYIILAVFTLSTTYMLAAICAFQNPEVVLIAIALTFGVFIGLTIFTFFTKYELTLLAGLATILFHVLLISIPLFIVFRNRWIFVLVTIAVIIVISIFIIYDTQMIASKTKYKLGYDDYIIGALLLYTDVVTLFLWILALLAATRSST